MTAADGALKLLFPGASHTTFIFFAPHIQTICATPAHIPGPFVLAVIFRTFFLSMCFPPLPLVSRRRDRRKLTLLQHLVIDGVIIIPCFVSDFAVGLGRGAPDLFTLQDSWCI